MTVISDFNKLVDRWVYPGGEVGIRIKNQTGAPPARVLARIQSSDDLTALLLYLRAAPGVLELVIPYLPYARQDRAQPGMPSSIKWLAASLVQASFSLSQVTTLDAHSTLSAEAFADEGLAFRSESPLPYIEQYLRALLPADSPSRAVWLVAPDAGAAPKVRGYLEELHAKGMPVAGVIQCQKRRDPVTGRLDGFELYRYYSRALKWSPSDLFVVVDDICDGGGTFLGVAQVLREQFQADAELHLFTTHGIYSKGLFDLLNKFDTVASTDSFIPGSQVAETTRRYVFNLEV